MTAPPWISCLEKALCELAQEYDPAAAITAFAFHPLYRVGVARESFDHIEKLFGKSCWGRLKHYSGNLARLDWPQYVGKNGKFLFPRIPSSFLRMIRKGSLWPPMKNRLF